MHASSGLRKTAPFLILGGLVLIGVGLALPHVVADLPTFFRPVVLGLGLVEAAVGALIVIKTPAP